MYSDGGTVQLIVVQEYLIVLVLKLLLHLWWSNNLLSFLKLVSLKKKGCKLSNHDYRIHVAIASVVQLYLCTKLRQR